MDLGEQRAEALEVGLDLLDALLRLEELAIPAARGGAEGVVQLEGLAGQGLDALARRRRRATLDEVALDELELAEAGVVELVALGRRDEVRDGRSAPRARAIRAGGARLGSA
jgi:hypothetical protein